MSKKLSKLERIKRRKAMADLERQADCSGHNHQVGSGRGAFFSGEDFLGLYLLTRLAMKRKRRAGQ